MIVYRPYKLPTKKLNLIGRMRRMRRDSYRNAGALVKWLKRRNKWKK